MSGLYWLAIFLYVSRYESAEEECEEMLMQEMEKARCRACVAGKAKDKTIRHSNK